MCSLNFDDWRIYNEYLISQNHMLILNLWIVIRIRVSLLMFMFSDLHILPLFSVSFSLSPNCLQLVQKLKELSWTLLVTVLKAFEFFFFCQIDIEDSLKKVPRPKYNKVHRETNQGSKAHTYKTTKPRSKNPKRTRYPTRKRQETRLQTWKHRHRQ